MGEGYSVWDLVGVFPGRCIAEQKLKRKSQNQLNKKRKYYKYLSLKSEKIANMYVSGNRYTWNLITPLCYGNVIEAVIHLENSYSYSSHLICLSFLFRSAGSLV